MLNAIIRVMQRSRKWPIQPFLIICCLLSISHVAAAHDCDPRSPCEAGANSAAALPDSQFAIGDFDGDRRPDLATVEFAHFNSLHSRYWISFQLSKGKLQTIGVTGPAGGLVITARDVNGDRAIDVVLVTPWRHQLVAVLLNDGAGNFAAVDPEQFRIHGVSPSGQMGTVPHLREDRTVLSFPSPALSDSGRKIPRVSESELAFSRVLDIAVTLFPSSAWGRAPPRSPLHV